MASAAIDWSGPLVTKSGKFGLLLPDSPIDRRKRVAVARDGSRPSSDPNEWSKPGREVTVWLYRENGRVRTDEQPCDDDIDPRGGRPA